MPAVWNTLLAYWSTAYRPRSRFARRIVTLLAFKLAAIIVLWLLFFAPSQRPNVDDTAVELNILSSVLPPPGKETADV